MPGSRKESHGVKSFTFPLFGVFVLVGFYWLLTDGRHLPALINHTLLNLRMPY